jgi:hypothetical protein
MKLQITKRKLNILTDDGKQLDLHYSFRIYMMYETITGKNLNFNALNSTDLFIIFYATVLSTLQYNKIENSLKYDDMMNMVDDCGGEFVLSLFAEWFVGRMKQQAEMMKEVEDNGETDKKKSLKKTKTAN